MCIRSIHVVRSLRALPAVLLAGLVIAAQPAPAQSNLQADAEALHREGNSLARSGLYHAALLRYREAAAAGAGSPLFQYNLGVVYYRLGRYDESAEALTIAGRDASLAPLATWNLALVELARDDTAAASAALQRVIEIGAPRTLRRAARERLLQLETNENRNARRAAASGGSSSGSGAPRRASDRDADDPYGFRASVFVRYAQDDNVYRAPSQAYVDLSDPAAPLVTPVVYSAGFMPVDLAAAYVLPNEAEDTEFIFAYTMNGDFYDSEFSNANRIAQRISIGADIDLAAQENRRRSLNSAFFVRTHDETNFNPDDGLDRAGNSPDFADRLAWRGAGIRVDYSHEIGRFLFGFDLNYERRQYEELLLIPNYDQDYYENEAFVDFELNSRSEIGLGLTRIRRIYDERLARDLAGVLSTGADFVEYDYQGVELSYRRLIGNALIAEVSLRRLDRADRFVGYYDYVQDSAAISLSYRPNRRLRITGRFSAYQYDFPNAFAFNNPLAERRALDVGRADVEFEYSLSGRLALWAEFGSESSTATDLREQIDRSVVMLGVRWRRD